MTMKSYVTASGNFTNKKSWKGITKHLQHDPTINHKNEYLNTEESQKLTQYNRHKVLVNYDQWTKNMFGAYVKDHDKHMLDKKRRFGSVERFLQVDGNGKARPLHPDQLYTEKFSSKKVYESMLKMTTSFLVKEKKYTPKQAKAKALNTIGDGLEKYADSFNKRNPHFKMFEYYVHLDEEGAPHLHAHVMPFTMPNTLTKKGRVKKPSWSLNHALGAQYGNFGQNKTNLKKFRRQEDKALVQSMNDAFYQDIGVRFNFDLYRKTDKSKNIEVGVNHDVYKTEHKKLANISSQIKTLRPQLKQAKHTKKTLDRQIQDDRDDLSELGPELSSAKQTIKEAKQKEDNESTLEAQIEADKKKKAELDQQIQQLRNAKLAFANVIYKMGDDVNSSILETNNKLGYAPLSLPSREDYKKIHAQYKNPIKWLTNTMNLMTDTANHEKKMRHSMFKRVATRLMNDVFSFVNPKSSKSLIKSVGDVFEKDEQKEVQQAKQSSIDKKQQKQVQNSVENRKEKEKGQTLKDWDIADD